MPPTSSVVGCGGGGPTPHFFRRFIIKTKAFYIYLWGSIILMVFISTAYGMFEYTKRYSFCKGCHEMNQAHDTWMSSKHGPILGEIDSCIACHAEEGAMGYIKVKLAGIKSVYYHVTGQITGGYLEVVKGTKPVYCIKTGCHSMKNLDTGLKIRVNHDFHTKMGFKCVACHDRIAHGWDDDLRSSPNMQNTCFNCHDEKNVSHEDCGKCHIYQENMLKGSGGKGLEDVPSAHGEDISCKDCHKKACFPDLNTCSSCHDNDLINEVNRRQAEVAIELENLKYTLKQLDRIFRYYEQEENQDKTFFEEKYKLFELAKANYEFISKDLSRGVHNFDYVWKMLDLSKQKADSIISSYKNTFTP
ncbi:NapC/NirT family cytochrome c [bacterium]|nr:NapC/NirT family cytochrome c [bacterium]